MKNAVFTLALILVPISGFAQNDLCKTQYDYLQSAIKVNTDYTCLDVIEAAKKTRERVEITKLKGVEFGTRFLQTFNENPMICGRTTTDLKYTDNRGRPQTVDISREMMVKTNSVPKGILLPLIPQELIEKDELKKLWTEYLESDEKGYDKNLSKMYSKHIEILKSSRTNFLKVLFKSLVENNDCVERVCASFNEDLKKCKRELTGDNAYAYLEEKQNLGHAQLPRLEDKKASGSEVSLPKKLFEVKTSK
jgi:hypothetical protein